MVILKCAPRTYLHEIWCVKQSMVLHSRAPQLHLNSDIFGGRPNENPRPLRENSQIDFGTQRHLILGFNPLPPLLNIRSTFLEHNRALARLNAVEVHIVIHDLVIFKFSSSKTLSVPKALFFIFIFIFFIFKYLNRLQISVINNCFTN